MLHYLQEGPWKQVLLCVDDLCGLLLIRVIVLLFFDVFCQKKSMGYVYFHKTICSLHVQSVLLVSCCEGIFATIIFMMIITDDDINDE